MIASYVHTYDTAQFKLDICTHVIVGLLERFVKKFASNRQAGSTLVVQTSNALRK